MMLGIIGEYGVPIVIFVLVVINIYGLIVCRRFIDRLKTHHQHAWIEMGAPELVNAENSTQANKLFLYIVFGKFFRRQDQVLNRDGMAMQILISISLLGVIVLFLLLRE